MTNKNKRKLTTKLKESIKSHSAVRNLTPIEATLTLEESNFIKDFPQLMPNRYIYSYDVIDGRPALKVTDTYLPDEKYHFSTYFTPTHGVDADGYSAIWIQDIVRKLNSFDNIVNLVK